MVDLTHSLYLCVCVGKVAPTDMNKHSSRSHVIFTITIEQSDIGTDKEQHVRMGKLHLVDLAVRIRKQKQGGGG